MWVQPTQRHRLGAVKARAGRQTTQDRGPARRVRLRCAVADAVPVRNCSDRVGEDGEALVEVLIIHDHGGISRHASWTPAVSQKTLMPGKKSFAAAVTRASSDACNVRATERELAVSARPGTWPIGACPLNSLQCVALKSQLLGNSASEAKFEEKRDCQVRL